MSDRKIIIKKIAMDDVKNILQTYLRQKRYVFEMKEFSSYEAIITVYNKKPESSVFISIMETFASRLLLPPRIKIQITLGQDKEDCLVSISGEVLMAEMDIVDPNPRAAGIAKLHHVIGEIASTITR
ncbi:MAG: hypothetical protein JXA41_03895 [Deltaproteobacteria bacterium]|nr:hypothetical protein [Deltaproteobacteria bacterium]